jgi:hypothetical protein
MIHINELKKLRDELDAIILKNELSQDRAYLIDYTLEECYWLDSGGAVNDTNVSGVRQIHSRSALTKEGAKVLQKRHKWDCLMQSLRDALGCGGDSFDRYKDSYYVEYDANGKQWEWVLNTPINQMGFVFHKLDDVKAVVNYLNKHYSGGFN